MNYPGRIIDAHLHIGSSPGFKPHTTKSTERILDTIDSGLVSVLCAGEHKQTFANQDIINFHHRHPQQIWGCLWINPQKKWQNQPLNDPAFKAIKLHPDENQYSPTTEILEQVFVKAQQLGKPIFIHTSVKSNPSLFENLLKDFSEVKVILSHMKPFSESTKLAKKYNQVYLDTAYCPVAEVARAVSTCGANKVIFGSDYPDISPFRSLAGRDLHQAYQKLVLSFVQNKKLFPADLEQIMCQNAARIFDL